MKNIAIILILVILVLPFQSCKAQSPIVGLDAKRHKTVSGAYFKDINNELNKFSGAWVHTNGNISFTIILQKKELVQINNNYRDILVGEYSYFENNFEIINTLASLDETPQDLKNHNIGGSSILNNNSIILCNDCAPDERRLKLYFTDPERSYLSVYIILRYLQDADQFGQEAQMTATIVPIGGGEFLPDENSPTETRVPYGEYLMVKQ